MAQLYTQTALVHDDGATVAVGGEASKSGTRLVCFHCHCPLHLLDLDHPDA